MPSLRLPSSYSKSAVYWKFCQQFLFVHEGPLATAVSRKIIHPASLARILERRKQDSSFAPLARIK
jgi:ActR/RegA family two-component response regulator